MILEREECGYCFRTEGEGHGQTCPDYRGVAYIAKPTPRVRERKRLQSKPHVIPWRIRAEVIALYEGVCQWCEVPGGALDCHHVTRRSQGGKDEVGNLQPVHRLCHQRIHEHPSEAKARGFLA